MEGYRLAALLWVACPWVWAFLRANPVILRRGYEGPFWAWVYLN